MKKIMEMRTVSIIFAMMLVAILSSCSKDDAKEPELNVSMTAINVGSSGGSESISITGNVKWTISGQGSWVQITPSTGEGDAGLVVNILENTDSKSRTCTLRVKSSDGTLSCDIVVTQDAAETTLSSDISSISLQSNSGSSQLLSIKSNSSWTISNVSDWLNVSALSGTGNTNITISTKSNNESSKNRTDTLNVNADMKVIKIVVNQAAGLSTCAVVPTNIVTLSDQLAFDYTYTKNTKYYQLEIWSKDVVDRWSDSDILTELLKNEHSTPNDQYITSLKNLYPNTEYVICTVAFDSDGKRGELIKTSLQTKSKVSIDALANINDAGVNGNYLVWTISKEGYCDTYHMICGTDCSIDAVSCYPVVYSWIINYYLKYNKQVLYDNNYSINLDLLNGGSYKLVYKLSTSNVFVATWGKFKDGTMSPTCQCVRGKISPPESAKMYRGNNVLFSSRKNAEPILVRTPKSAFKGIFVR